MTVSRIICSNICRFFYGHALTFHLIESPLLHTMIQSVNDYGKGLKHPSCQELQYKCKIRTKVSERNRFYISVDGWTDGKGCILPLILLLIVLK